MKQYILSLNSESKFYHHEMVPFRPKYSAFEEKNTKYDIVFFARVTKDKGIEDLIEALPAVKKKLQV